MKAKKALIIPVLIVLMAIIWIVNARFLSNITRETPKPVIVEHELPFTAESLATPDFKFTPLKRDPFNVIIDTTPKEPVMPKFSLRGVVINKKGSLALMELSDGNVYTMKQGQKYLGVLIKEITPKQVIAEFRGHKVTFEVWQ
jgi:type II secretory pathway component PulC